MFFCVLLCWWFFLFVGEFIVKVLGVISESWIFSVFVKSGLFLCCFVLNFVSILVCIFIGLFVLGVIVLVILWYFLCLNVIVCGKVWSVKLSGVWFLGELLMKIFVFNDVFIFICFCFFWRLKVSVLFLLGVSVICWFCEMNLVFLYLMICGVFVFIWDFVLVGLLFIVSMLFWGFVEIVICVWRGWRL